MKTLVLRADAGPRIGTGHVFRCLALGQAWREDGGKVVLVGRGYPEGLLRRAESIGVRVVSLTSAHPDPADVRLTKDTALRHEAEWVIADGYHFDLSYQRAIRAQHKLLLIDDMAHHPTYESDLLLNQNLGAERIAYRTDPGTRLLLGTRFSLLRSEFSSWRSRARPDQDGRPHLLITLGGSDPDNTTLKVVQALAPQIGCAAVLVLIGPANPHGTTVRQAVAAVQGDMAVLTDVADMPSLLHWADLAITAGGSTCWELAFMGVPMVLIVVADNQRGIADALAGNGAAVNLGWHAGLQPDQIGGIVRELLADAARRKHMAARARTLVDGEGRDRVIQAMLQRPLRLRTANGADCRQIWEWSNDPSVRAVSFASADISWDRHQSWFRQKLQDPAVRIYVALDAEDVPVGQVRFERNGADATISISLDRRVRGKGLGRILLEEATRRYCREQPATECVHAYIKRENHASIRAFEHAGYCLAKETRVGGETALDFIRRGTP
jgi:UDP-2,4-diacetamido-2,4,6-trideoxy-beta-L-altropyranose hydrolase